MNGTIHFIGSYASILACLITLFILINTYRILNNAKKEKQRLNKKVKIILKEYESNKTIDIPGTVTKSELLRQEVLGRIGMIPMKQTGKRFEIKYLNSKEFIENLNLTKESMDIDTLTIYCLKEEIAQFNVKV